MPPGRLREVIYVSDTVFWRAYRHDGAGASVRALLTEGERILYAGSLHGAEERAEGTVRRVDLKGRALLPAFVDAHSHLTAYANTFLQAAPGGVRAGWEELGRRLSAFAAREGLAPGEWVRGEGSRPQ